MRNQVVTAILIGAFAFASPPMGAAPFAPASENEIVDRLPGRTAQSAAAASRETRSMQGVLKANRQNLDIALRIAQLNIRRARSESDPRYLGRAQAALAPWWNAARPPVTVLVLRATIRQSLHQFSAARTDLEQAVAREPANAQAWLTLATIQLVTGDETAARTNCERLAGLAQPPVHAACIAAIDGSRGRAGVAGVQLARTLKSAPHMNKELRAWIVVLQAELAERAGYLKTADAMYRDALKLDRRDAYTIAAYADYLLDQHRPREVLKLIPADTGTDILLLRRVLAAQTLNTPEANAAASTLASRYDAARERGDRLHLREEARFLLHVRRKPAEALALATENWQTQKEPADLRILLEAATATGKREPAQPALAWLDRTHLEGRIIARLAAQARQL